jgi:molybdate transport system permease protein
MAIILAQTFVSLPLFVRSVEASLRSIDQDFIEAAYLDGAGRWDVFRSIELPLAWPGVVAGLTLAWARSIGEFGATLFVGGNVPGRTQTGATLIMTLMEGQLSDALWLAAALAGISALSLGAWHRMVRR